MIIQFTGLSGAGKTTLANKLCLALEHLQYEVAVVDGDVYRKTICSDLGFSKADRSENIRRLGKAAHDLEKEYTVVIIAAINPFEVIRKEMENLYGAKTVWIHCTLEVLTQRDTKGLYRRAALPETHPDKINNLTGVNDTYELPKEPHLIIDTATTTETDCINSLMNFILSLNP